jgi:hypothetical protein
LTLPAAELAQRLGASLEALADISLRRFRTLDEDGNPVYDWDEIERVGQLPADEITPLEYYALAYLYSQMGEEDMARFVQRLAVPNAMNNVDNGEEHQCNSWTFDEAKITFLKAALARVYADSGQSPTNGSYAHLSVLATLPYLGRFYISNGNVSHMIGDSGCINDEFGKEYPSISISICPDGSVIIDYPISVWERDGYAHLDRSIERQALTLSAPQDAGLAVGDLVDFLNGSLKDQFGIDALAEDVTMEVLGNIPGVGMGMSIISLGAAISDYYQGQEFLGQHTATNETIKDLAGVFGKFDYEAVIVPYAEGKLTVFYYPGDDTDAKISEFNSLLDSVPGLIADAGRDMRLGENVGEVLEHLKNAERLKREIGFPITEQDIQNNPDKIRELLRELDRARLL